MEKDISPAVGAYCTLRSSTGSKNLTKCKKLQNSHFGSLKVRGSNHPYHELLSKDENNKTPPPVLVDENDGHLHLKRTESAAMNSVHDSDVADAIESDDIADRRNTLASSQPSTSKAAATPRSKAASTTANGHSLLMEFKRLGSYCTLRNEQKRKYLLRTISNLRNTRNDVVAARSTPSATLHENDFAVDESFALSSSAERIEDCLLELDAYLEEIDKDGGFQQFVISGDCEDDDDDDDELGAISLSKERISEDEEEEILKTIECLLSDEGNKSFLDCICAHDGADESIECELKFPKDKNKELAGDNRRNLNRGHPYRNTINIPSDNVVIHNEGNLP